MWKLSIKTRLIYLFMPRNFSLTICSSKTYRQTSILSSRHRSLQKRQILWSDKRILHCDKTHSHTAHSVKQFLEKFKYLRRNIHRNHVIWPLMTYACFRNLKSFFPCIAEALEYACKLTCSALKMKRSLNVSGKNTDPFLLYRHAVYLSALGIPRKIHKLAHRQVWSVRLSHPTSSWLHICMNRSHFCSHCESLASCTCCSRCPWIRPRIFLLKKEESYVSICKQECYTEVSSLLRVLKTIIERFSAGCCHEDTLLSFSTVIRKLNLVK